MRNLLRRFEDLFLSAFISIPLLFVLAFLFILYWNWFESATAPKVAARALNTFVAPCQAPGMELRCETARSLPTGRFKIANVDLGPFSGATVTAEYESGFWVQMEVFPALFGPHQVVIDSIGRE